jgi:hypothetical protein
MLFNVGTYIHLTNNKYHELNEDLKQTTVEPVYSETPKDHGNVSDCTGCQNTQV